MVSVITCTIRNENIDQVLENYNRQSWKDKELIIILNKDSMDINHWKKKCGKFSNVRVFQLPSEQTLGECLNFGIEKANHDYIAKFDDDDYYASYYLEEAMNAFKNTNADIVGKDSYYSYITRRELLVLRMKKQNQYVWRVAGATLVFKKSIMKKVKFTNKQNGGSDTVFQADCRKNGYKIYCTSQYNFVVIRNNPESHTWKINEEFYLSGCRIIAITKDFKRYIERGK